MKKATSLILALFLMMGISETVFAQVTIASDDASNYSTWSNGNNSGEGFTSWDLWTQNTDGSNFAGHFLASSSARNLGDIDTDSKSFGMYGNPIGSSPQANAQRFFTNTGSTESSGRAFLLEGMKFSIDLAIAYRDGYKGIDILDQSYNQLFNFNVGSNDYTTSDGSLGWTYDQYSIFEIEITQVNSTQYQVSIIRGTDTYTSSLRTGQVSGFKLYVGNTTNDDLNNLHFNNLKVTASGEVELGSIVGYRLVSAPTTPTLSSLLDPIWTQATTGADTDQGDPNVFTWPNTATDGSDTNWNGVTDLTTTLSAGSGVLVYVFDDTDYNGSGGDLPVTLSVTGTENGDVTGLSLNSNADGWTLVGNPFASTIDFDATNKTDLTDVAYVWDPDSANWDSWNGTSGDLTDGLITPFQGFFIQNASIISSTPDIDFEADDKSSGGSFYGKAKETFAVRMEVEGAEVGNSMWMQFSDAGSYEAKVMGDALELQPLAERYAQFGMAKAEELFDIAHLPVGDVSYELPVNISSTESGEFTVKATDFNVPTGMKVEFHDYQTGYSAVIDENFSYSFDLNAPAQKRTATALLAGPIEAQSTETGRFGIVIDPAIINSNEEVATPQAFSLEQNYPNPFNPSTTIEYSVDKAGAVNLSVYNLMGQKVAELVNEAKSAGSYKVQWNAAGAASGMYYYRLDANGVSITRKMTLIK